MRRGVRFLPFVLSVAAGCIGPSNAPALEVGDLAPEFTLPGTDGQTYSLSGLLGRTVVLAWFPKAFTGG